MRLWIEKNASPKPKSAVLLTLRKSEFLLSTPVPGSDVPDQTTEVQKQISIKNAIEALNEEERATLTSAISHSLQIFGFTNPDVTKETVLQVADAVEKQFRSLSIMIHPDKTQTFAKLHNISDPEGRLQAVMQYAFKALQNAKGFVQCFIAMNKEDEPERTLVPAAGVAPTPAIMMLAQTGNDKEATKRGGAAPDSDSPAAGSALDSDPELSEDWDSGSDHDKRADFRAEGFYLAEEEAEAEALVDQTSRDSQDVNFFHKKPEVTVGSPAASVRDPPAKAFIQTSPTSQPALGTSKIRVPGPLSRKGQSKLNASSDCAQTKISSYFLLTQNCKLGALEGHGRNRDDDKDDSDAADGPPPGAGTGTVTNPAGQVTCSGAAEGSGSGAGGAGTAAGNPQLATLARLLKEAPHSHSLEAQVQRSDPRFNSR
jgi:hypothetical protein